MKMTISASIHARWGHRVDGLIHTHAWKVGAKVSGPVDSAKIYPADDLERELTCVVEPWRGHYLTCEDVGPWNGFAPLVWEREPTVEEVVRHIWETLDERFATIPTADLESVTLEEASEFDRCRVVTLSRT